jgi:serine/threonine protein phosphatase PrpC
LRVQVTSFALAQASTRESQDACDAQQWQNTVVAALADGVGEARHGGLAARRTVVNTIAHLKSRPRHWSIAKALEEFARSINRTLYQESMARFEQPEMLTTMATVIIEGATLH